MSRSLSCIMFQRTLSFALNKLAAVAAANCCVASLVFSMPAVGGSEEILYQYHGIELKDSKWGALVDFQMALNLNLSKCSELGVPVDGVFGSRTVAGMRRLALCRGFTTFGIGAGQPYDGVITQRLWTAAST